MLNDSINNPTSIIFFFMLINFLIQFAIRSTNPPSLCAGVKFYCRNCGREGHRRHYCPELSNSSMDRRFRCRLCGEKGHNRRTCWRSRASSARSMVSRHHHCRICGQTGHNRRTCPQAQGTGRKDLISGTGRTYACRLCLEKGHNIRTCPIKN